jgi:hypothetical protein
VVLYPLISAPAVIRNPQPDFEAGRNFFSTGTPLRGSDPARAPLAPASKESPARLGAFRSRSSSLRHSPRCSELQSACGSEQKNVRQEGFLRVPEGRSH